MGPCRLLEGQGVSRSWSEEEIEKTVGAIRSQDPREGSIQGMRAQHGARCGWRGEPASAFTELTARQWAKHRWVISQAVAGAGEAQPEWVRSGKSFGSR